MTTFKLIGKAKVTEKVSVNKYRDERTGLTVVLTDVPGPVVKGEFVLCTESFSDDGLPHTLEHLIFLGSEMYPYKGVLDLLANRCLASGTNAYTEITHTGYTVDTAGSEGFLKLLPIYLDHILYPTLTDSGFITEVHHINGDGEDAGVVYSEKQGSDYYSDIRARSTLLKTIYPDSGLSYDVGGITGNIRTSTSMDEIRPFHQKFYRPENLTLIITGQIEADQVFEALRPIQEKVLRKPKRVTFEKPWQIPIGSIDEWKDIKILYPSPNEDYGLVYVGFLGPNCVTDYMTFTTVDILLRYLTQSSVSSLKKEMIDIDEPFANEISYDTLETFNSLIYVSFDTVPTNKLDKVLGKFQEILNKISKGEDPLDMVRIKSIIEKKFMTSLIEMENTAHETMAPHLVKDALFGRSEADLKNRVDFRKIFEHSSNLTKLDWIDILNKYFVNKKYVCVKAFPSKQEQERMNKDESDRLINQKRNLGAKGLQEKAEILAKAIEQNDIPPPNSMLKEVQVPNIENMNYHSSKVYKSSMDNDIGNVFKFSEVPVYTEIYDLQTDFTYITITMNCEGLDNRLRPYILLFMELLLEVPIKKGYKNISHEEVVSSLERNTVKCKNLLGFGGQFSYDFVHYTNLAILDMQIEPSKYELVVNLILDLLHNSLFTVDRIRNVISKILNTISELKKEAGQIAPDVLTCMYFSPESNSKTLTSLIQEKFVRSILKELDDTKNSIKVLNDLYLIREFLTKASNIALQIGTNLSDRINESKNLSKVWKRISSENSIPKSEMKFKVLPEWKQINYKGFGLNPGSQGKVIGIGSVEGACLKHAVEAINDFKSPDLAALRLYLQYIAQTEGPFWKRIRGQGLAYGYTIDAEIQSGLLVFGLDRATNVVSAVKETKKIIDNQLNDNIWDDILLESAKSSLIYETIKKEASMNKLFAESLRLSYSESPRNLNKELVKEIKNITKEKLAEVGVKYISKLFTEVGRTVVICQPDKVPEIVDEFDKMNMKLEIDSSFEE